MALAAGGAGVQVEGAGSAGVAMATEPTAGGGAASVEGASCPDIAPTTAIVTSSAGEGDGSAPSASVGLASSASFSVGGISTTLWRWGWAKKTKDCKTELLSVFSRTTQYLYSLTSTYPARSAVLALRFHISRRRWGIRGASSDNSTDDPEELFACALSPVARLPSADSLPAVFALFALAAALGNK
jgi:hypothetical protein